MKYYVQLEQVYGGKSKYIHKWYKNNLEKFHVVKSTELSSAGITTYEFIDVEISSEEYLFLTLKYDKLNAIPIGQIYCYLKIIITLDDIAHDKFFIFNEVKNLR